MCNANKKPACEAGSLQIGTSKPDPTFHPATRQEEPEHRGERRRFIVWAAMCGYVSPDRLAERVLQDLADEAGVAK